MAQVVEIFICGGQGLLAVSSSSCITGSFRLSHIFWQCSPLCIIMKGVITIDKNNVHGKGQGQRLKFKVAELQKFLRQFLVFPDHNSSLDP